MDNTAQNIVAQQDHAARKLLFVVNDPAFFLSHRLNIGEAAKRSGFEVIVAGPNEESAKSVVDSGFKFIPLSINRWGMNPLKEIQSIRNLDALYRKVQPDLVHHVTIKPVLYGSIAARMAKVPAVVNAVSGLGFIFISRGLKAGLRRGIIKFLYRIGFAHSNQKTIFQNPDDLQLFLDNKLLKERNTVIVRGSGVDTKRYLGIPEPVGKVRVLMPSRLSWDKGVGEFVEAAKILRQRGVEAEFAIAGGTAFGNPAGVPPKKVEQWNEEGDVKLLGHSSDMIKEYQASHIVCLPSYREGLPRALIEAASCGRPIVSTDVPGCREIVQHEVNGFLVPSHNSEKLADALEQLIENPNLRHEMGQRGRRMVMEDGFAEDAVVENTLDVYRGLVFREQ